MPWYKSWIRDRREDLLTLGAPATKNMLLMVSSSFLRACSSVETKSDSERIATSTSALSSSWFWVFISLLLFGEQRVPQLISTRDAIWAYMSAGEQYLSLDHLEVGRKVNIPCSKLIASWLSATETLYDFSPCSITVVDDLSEEKWPPNSWYCDDFDSGREILPLKRPAS